MSDRPASASVRRFADDLRRIREARGISTADLHNETKIPESLLRSFEETGLFDHPMFNRVYLRSFVRSYSEVLGITPEIALEALDEAFESRYEGRLRWEFLGEERPTGAPAETPVETQPEAEQAPTPAPVPPVTPARAAAVAEDRDALRRGERPVTPTPRKQVEPVEDISWAVQSPPSTPPYMPLEEERSGAGKWILAVLGVVAIAAVAYFLLRGQFGGNDQEPTAAVAPDTSASTDTARTVAAADTATVNLPDTLTVVLQAIGDGVQGMRVKPDTTTRFPIWIERDSYRELKFVNRISLQNQLHDVKIKIEGRDYTPRPDTSGGIVINRQDVQRLLAGATSAQ